MKKVITIIILSIALFNSCSSQNAKQNQFDIFKKEISPKAYRLFPIETNSVNQCSYISIDFPAAYEFLGYCGLNIAFDYDSISFANNIIKLEQDKIAKYNKYDTCIFIIPDTTVFEVKKCKKTCYPIYNFHNVDNSDYKNLLSENRLVYYILEYQKGVYSNKVDIQNHKIYNMASGCVYKHGYCNGAIVDIKKYKIIYWIFIW